MSEPTREEVIAATLAWWDGGRDGQPLGTVLDMYPWVQEALFDHVPGLRERVEEYSKFLADNPNYRSPMPVIWFGEGSI